MKRNGLLVFLTVLLSAQMEGRDRGHARAEGSAPFRHPGAIMGPGIRGSGVGHPSAFGFGVGRRGSGVRWSWPLFSSGLGVYYSGYNGSSQLADADGSPDSENTASPTLYYYQKPAKQYPAPSCKDAWATKGSSSSLGSFMHRVFELQCQNRHPEAQAKPSEATEPAKN
jgi:hypothetical protein